MRAYFCDGGCGRTPLDAPGPRNPPNWEALSRYAGGGAGCFKMRAFSGVVIVDDILDEGGTLAAILEYCREAGARSVSSCVLVDKKHDRKAYPGFKADFCGLDVEDRFLFGFGMDYKGYWRNAPGIYAPKGL